MEDDARHQAEPVNLAISRRKALATAATLGLVRD